MSVKGKIETCITVGARIMLLTIILFAIGYLFLIGALVASFSKLRRDDRIPGVDDYEGP
jgi:hypothetical protein